VSIFSVLMPIHGKTILNVCFLVKISLEEIFYENVVVNVFSSICLIFTWKMYISKLYKKVA